jgi:probable HAF family extracellular repeat protein
VVVRANHGGDSHETTTHPLDRERLDRQRRRGPAARVRRDTGRRRTRRRADHDHPARGAARHPRVRWRGVRGQPARPGRRRRRRWPGQQRPGALVAVRHGDTTVLEHPDGKAWAEDVNDRRQITGELEPTEGGLLRGFRWQAGVFTEIVGPPGMSVWPTAINERGDVSGLLQNDAGTERIGFLWRDGVLTELPAPDGGGWVEPTAMNDRGHVVGSFTPAGSSVTHPFRWAGGRMTDLLAGRADAGHAYDVNNAGLVVGDAGGRPAAWSSGRTIDIGTPGRTGTARDVDEGGVIVGESASPSDNRVFRLRGGRTVFSAAYPADTRLDVTGVDARGRVAGTVVTVDYDATPVVWRD